MSITFCGKAYWPSEHEAFLPVATALCLPRRSVRRRVAVSLRVLPLKAGLDGTRRLQRFSSCCHGTLLPCSQCVALLKARLDRARRLQRSLILPAPPLSPPCPHAIRERPAAVAFYPGSIPRTSPGRQRPDSPMCISSSLPA
jgi:hypothetical protein